MAAAVNEVGILKHTQADGTLRLELFWRLFYKLTLKPGLPVVGVSFLALAYWIRHCD